MKPSPQQICDALILLQKAGVDLNSIRDAVPQPARSIGFQEYYGMSYEQASREAARLLRCGDWFCNFDRLTELRQIMLAQGPK